MKFWGGVSIVVWWYTMYGLITFRKCIIFTSLCKNFVKLTWVLAEAFRCHGHHFQCLTVLVELRTVKHWKWCPWHRKASAKTQVSLTKFFQSEVKLIHIIVQNNTYYSARSRWTKQQQIFKPIASKSIAKSSSHVPLGLDIRPRSVILLVKSFEMNPTLFLI